MTPPQVLELWVSELWHYLEILLKLQEFNYVSICKGTSIVLDEGTVPAASKIVLYSHPNFSQTVALCRAMTCLECGVCALGTPLVLTAFLLILLLALPP